MHFAIFPPHLSKIMCLQRKSEGRSCEMLCLSRKNYLGKPEDLMLREMHLCRSSSNVPRLPSFLQLLQTLTFCSLWTRCRIHCACYTKRLLNRNALRATTERAFQQLNFQKCSETGVLCAFWLRNVLRATTVFIFLKHLNWQKCSEPAVFLAFRFRNVFRASSTAQLPKVLQNGDALTIFTFLLRDALRATTACIFWSLIRPDSSAPAAFVSLLFDPPQPQNMRNKQCFVTFLPFRALICFLLTHYSDFFSCNSLTVLIAVAASVH